MSSSEQFRNIYATNETFRREFDSLDEEQQKKFLVNFLSQEQREPGFMEKVDRGIGRGMQAIGRAAQADLVPEPLSRVGAQIGERLPEGMGEGLATGVKGMAFAPMGAPPHISRGMVDEPLQTGVTALQAAGLHKAIGAGQALKYAGGLTGAWVGGGATKNVVPEKYRHIGSLAGIFLGGLVGTGMGHLAQKPARFIGKNLAQLQESQLVQHLSNHSEWLGKRLNDHKSLVRQMYQSEINPHKGIKTTFTEKDAIANVDDVTRQQIRPMLTQLRKSTARHTLYDATGKKIVKPYTVGELNTFRQDIQEQINRGIYSPQPKDVSTLMRLRDSVDDAMRSALPKHTQEKLGQLDKMYGPVKVRLDKLQKEIGWTHKDRTVDTTKLDKLLSPEGDLTAKQFLRDLAELDEAVKPVINEYKRNAIRYHKFIADRPPKSSMVREMARLGARIAVPPLLRR